MSNRLCVVALPQLTAAAAATAASAVAGVVEYWGSQEQRQEGLLVRLVLGSSVTASVEPRRVS